MKEIMNIFFLFFLPDVHVRGLTMPTPFDENCWKPIHKLFHNFESTTGIATQVESQCWKGTIQSLLLFLDFIL